MRPAAIATPPATTAICPDVTGEAGAPPFATTWVFEAFNFVLSALADDMADEILLAAEVNEAETEDGTGLALSTSLVYNSMTPLPMLSRYSC